MCVYTLYIPRLIPNDQVHGGEAFSCVQNITGKILLSINSFISAKLPISYRADYVQDVLGYWMPKNHQESIGVSWSPWEAVVRELLLAKASLSNKSLFYSYNSDAYFVNLYWGVNAEVTHRWGH